MSGLSVNGTQSTATGGLGSGLDVTSTVTALMQLQRLPETQMQAQQAQMNLKAQALQSINSSLATLQTSVQTLSDFTGQLGSRSATSSDPGLLSATATGGALLTNHQVIITSLAQTSSFYTNTLASGSATLTAGSFSIKVGSATAVPITIDGTNNTLDGLAQTINAANAGVTASVITDSKGARLALLSSTSGAAGNISIPANGTALTLQVATTGKDAALQLDGIDLSSGSNTVQNAIPGVTLNLTGAAPLTTVTLSVTPNTSQAVSAVQAFVTNYNAAVQGINAQFSYNQVTKQGQPLAGDSSLRIVQQQLYTAATFSTTNNNGVNSLADLGISSNNDGTLTLDTSKLSGVLVSNNAAVQNFFQAATTGFARQLNTTLQSLTDPTQGAISVDLKGVNDSVSSLQSQIDDFEVRMASVQVTLTAQYSAMSATMQQMPLLLQQIKAQLGFQ